MEKLDLKGVHVYQKAPGTQSFRLVKTNPALRLGGENGHLYIQSGVVFEEGGKAVAEKDIPGWFREELAKVDPRALAEAGYRPKAKAA